MLSELSVAAASALASDLARRGMYCEKSIISDFLSFSARSKSEVIDALSVAELMTQAPSFSRIALARLICYEEKFVLRPKTALKAPYLTEFGNFDH
jgi:hypothetical protein